MTDPRSIELVKRVIVGFLLDEGSTEDLSEITTSSERLAMMGPLAETVWTMAGNTLPMYDRENIPGRLYRAVTKEEGKE